MSHFSGSSTTVTDLQAPALSEKLSTGMEAGGSTQKNKEEIVTEKKEANNVIDNDSTSEVQMCRDWKRGRCTRGDKCRYKHEILQVRASISWTPQLPQC